MFGWTSQQAFLVLIFVLSISVFVVADDIDLSGGTLTILLEQNRVDVTCSGGNVNAAGNGAKS